MFTKPQTFPINFTCFNLGFHSALPRVLSLPPSTTTTTNSDMDLIPKIGKLFFVSQQNKTNQPVEMIESDNNNGVCCKDGFDAVSAAGTTKAQPDHLVIMVNGIIGSAADWGYAAKQFVKRLPDKVIVHCSECNSATLTFDGVDRMGERLAEEVMAVTKRWPEVSKISFVAHSLGGLVARYAIGRLYENFPVIGFSGSNGKDASNSEQCHEQLYEARIAGLQPINFITVATPHLGSRGHRQLPLLCGLPFLERSASQTAHWIAGRSGKHLFLTDNDDGETPLLLRMVNDSKDIKFISALGSFKRRVAYANANYDHMVGWGTSSIRRQHELPNDCKRDQTSEVFSSANRMFTKLSASDLKKIYEVGCTKGMTEFVEAVVFQENLQIMFAYEKAKEEKLKKNIRLEKGEVKEGEVVAWNCYKANRVFAVTFDGGVKRYFLVDKRYDFERKIIEGVLKRKKSVMSELEKEVIENLTNQLADLQEEETAEEEKVVLWGVRDWVWAKSRLRFEASCEDGSDKILRHPEDLERIGCVVWVHYRLDLAYRVGVELDCAIG
ncbi:hypothetical protein OSB04_020949 [Centaurea solstitialis]|uniref:DUF676 domain-containing protein n=1 Tax=Centaurea solstitialis TaxID=347529 RepID=A0AA38WHB9_9ASTR|nr:hypothetical protein OSB04_020949 [Centaurea solstitialis]